ncbi:hypothetical protein H2248_001684 [Termitomyces sp. 'cryptogamus']|nr:hypothetical protein H2248_001684 [Termitomyces sp. 'cryptogamus']
MMFHLLFQESLLCVVWTHHAMDNDFQDSQSSIMQTIFALSLFLRPQSSCNPQVSNEANVVSCRHRRSARVASVAMTSCSSVAPLINFSLFFIRFDSQTRRFEQAGHGSKLKIIDRSSRTSQTIIRAIVGKSSSGRKCKER